MSDKLLVKNTFLKEKFESDSLTSGIPLAIAFIGHTNITKSQARSCCQQLEEQLTRIKKLHEPDTCYWVDLVSPLAPGSDIALVTKAADFLNSHANSIAGFRLIIPHAVLWDKVDDDYRPHWAQGNQWLYDQEEYTHSGSNSDWKAFKEVIQNEREKIIANVKKAGFPVEVLDISMIDNQPMSNHEGYIRAAQWIVEKTDILIAVLDHNRKSAATSDEWADGGTGHTVAQWHRLKKGQYIEIDPFA